MNGKREVQRVRDQLAPVERRLTEALNSAWAFRWGNRAAVRRAVNGPWPGKGEHSPSILTQSPCEPLALVPCRDE